MVFCVNCGEINIPDANFCYNCGTKLSDLSDEPLLSESDYRNLLYKYNVEKFVTLDKEFSAISKTISDLPLNAVELTIKKIDEIMDDYSIVLSEFKLIRMPEKYKKLHMLWTSVHECSFEAMGEIRKAVEFNDQSYMDKAEFLAKLMFEKTTLADEELNAIHHNQ